LQIIYNREKELKNGKQCMNILLKPYTNMCEHVTIVSDENLE